MLNLGARLFPLVSRESEIAYEVERCTSILSTVGIELVSHRHDHDGHVVELRLGKRTTRGFGLSVKAAFEDAAQGHRS